MRERGWAIRDQPSLRRTRGQLSLKPFSRAEGTKTPGESGTGVGAAACTSPGGITDNLDCYAILPL